MSLKWYSPIAWATLTILATLFMQSNANAALSKYILVQNVATERSRVYERCQSSPCRHKLIFESEMVVGRQEGDWNNPSRFITWLGRYKLTKWVKFYEDNERHYPSWYHPQYPQLPRPSSRDQLSATMWMSRDALPNGQGNGRGAFGWYAAMVGPNANSQWIHGTYGWGIEGDRYIEYTRSFWVNLFANPRSAGCTRFENRAVAYLRHILGEGTDVVRIYARETYLDETLAAYRSRPQAKNFPWILTTEGVKQTNAATIEANAVRARGVKASQVLESGNYTVDMVPTAVGLSGGNRSSGSSGNTYGIPQNLFNGYFLVDAGLTYEYRHPRGLAVGGFADRGLPADMEYKK